MTGIIGIKDNFLREKRELLKEIEKLKKEGKSWEEVEAFVRETFKEELSFFRPNLFTYFLLFGGTFLLPLLYLWKFYFPVGTTAHFISKLLFVISAMFSLKGIVGHYVVVFLNRDRFESELRVLKAHFEGGDNGKQPN